MCATVAKRWGECEGKKLLVVIKQDVQQVGKMRRDENMCGEKIVANYIQDVQQLV